MFGKEILFLSSPIIASLCENAPDDFIYDDFLQIKYKYINQTDSWINHERHCQELDPRAHLPTIYGKRKNRFVFSMAETHVAIGMAYLNDDDLTKEYWINKDDPDEYHDCTKFLLSVSCIRVLNFQKLSVTNKCQILD